MDQPHRGSGQGGYTSAVSEALTVFCSSVGDMFSKKATRLHNMFASISLH